MEWIAREGWSTPGEENDKVGRDGQEGVKVDGGQGKSAKNVTRVA